MTDYFRKYVTIYCWVLIHQGHSILILIRLYLSQEGKGALNFILLSPTSLKKFLNFICLTCTLKILVIKIRYKMILEIVRPRSPRIYILITTDDFQSSHITRRLAIRYCPICLPDRMPAVAEGGDGWSALHQISKLAQRDAQHRQETEIISADQLAGTEVGFHLEVRECEIKRHVGVHLEYDEFFEYEDFFLDS